MSLRDLMARHARTVLVRADHHGESVTYVFKTPPPGETTRTFLAVVNRLDVDPASPGVPQIATRRATVFLPRHDVAGVESIAPGDKLQVVMRLGEAAVTARIGRVVEQDDGGFLVEVTA